MWLLLALAGPVLWAVSTHIDKYLVEKYFKRSNTAVLMVFTGLIGLLFMPVIWAFDRNVFALSLRDAAVIMVSGALYMGGLLLYLRALQGEEASVVSPLLQASVLWAALLGFFFLDERLTLLQMLGGALIVGAMVFLSLDRPFDLRKMKGVFLLRMLACTLMLALSSFAFKFFAVQDDEFWRTTFWTFAGHAVFGAMLLAVPGQLRGFIRLFRAHPGPVVAINGSNELINLGGVLSVRYASLLAPLALVQAVSGTTPIFVFFFGVLLTRFAPRIGREDLSRRNLYRKIAGAALVAAGIALMNV